ncbi:MAG: cytochrome c biogenesis protein CcsA [Rectinemataceae bacterium]|nr:cytochrome c biogenesis protein CcsA [Rectinemataceae bacterium]
MIASLAFIFLTVAALVQIIYIFRKDASPDPFSHYLSLAAGLFLAVEIGRRSIAISFFAVTSLFESLLLLATILALLGFAFRIQHRIKITKGIVFGVDICAMIFLAVASSPLAPSDILPPVPALQSAWLVLHVAFTMIGEAFFAAGLFGAVLQLAAKDEEKRSSHDRFTYTSIAVGYPIFTAGALIFGAIWAEKAWGVWWSWDPKETWALVTWLVYTAYLHFRLVRKNTGKLMPILVITGFAFAMFTFFGVNLLLPGLHSYG